MDRSTWQDYFMAMAWVASKRSTCLRRKVGAIAVKDNRILSTGYNGSPKSLRHCKEIGCIRQRKNIPSGERHELCRAVHAEQNVIIQAAVHGVALLGADIYCTYSPCTICAKMIINCGIRCVYFQEGYPDDTAEALLAEARIPILHLKG